MTDPQWMPKDEQLQARAFSACLHSLNHPGEPDVFSWHCVTCKRILEALRAEASALLIAQAAQVEELEKENHDLRARVASLFEGVSHAESSDT